jgi:hypothetical protein
MQTQVGQMRSPREVGIQVSVVERNDSPGVWTVEAIDIDGDGDIYQALFAGRDAEKRAHEYARFKYGLTYT